MIKPYSKLYTKSNYLISKLRKELDIRSEIYFRWDIEGAFNGCYLLGISNNYQILCYDKITKKQSISENSYMLTDLTLDITNSRGNLNYKAIDTFLKRHEAAFEKQYQMTNMTDQITRIFGSALVRVEDLNEIEDIYYRTMSQLDLDYYDSYITNSSLDSNYAKLDLLFEFANPVKESHVVDSIAQLFHQPQSGLLGGGCLCINHKGQQFIHEGLKWSHLIGRHF